MLRKILLFLYLVLTVRSIYGQHVFPPGGGIIMVTVDPAGACSIGPLQYNTTNGHLWGCDAGTWAQIAGSGGGATIPSVTNLIKGNGSGNGADTKVAITSPATAATIAFAADNESITLPNGTLAAYDFNNITTIVHDLIFTDATYDIGKSGATRPRDLFASRNGVFGGTLTAIGHVTFEGVTSAGATGTVNLVYSNSPALVTPNLGTPSTLVLSNATLGTNTVLAQKFFGTAAPGSVSGNLPGDFFSDTTNHNEYWCNAVSGTAAPACTTVSAGGWALLNGSSGGGNVNNSGTPTSTQIAQWVNATTIQGITLVPIANGGTNSGTASGAATNILPTATRAGDIVYWDGAVWNHLAGNNSGTNFFQENASGVPSWASGSSSIAWSSISNPSGNLTLSMGSNTSTFNTTTAVSQFFKWANTTAAINVTSQPSPILSLCGTAWHAGASAEDCLTIQNVPNNTTDAGGTFAFGHSGGNSGTITTTFPGPVQLGSSGGAASFVDLIQGTDNTGSAALGANSVFIQAPTSVSSTFGYTLPNAPAAGLVHATNATPSVLSISLVANADLINSATTVNGQTCTLGSTCTIEAATSGQLAVSGGSGASLTGWADFTVSSVTGTLDASGVIDTTAGSMLVATQSAGNSTTKAASTAFVTNAVAVAAALSCPTSSASGSAEVCNTTPTFTPVAGSSIVFQADIANTGAFTLNVNSLGAKSVVTNDGAALVANDILASPFQVILTYDGTKWRMQGQSGNTTGTGATVLANSPTLVTPALGTPTALVLTNATGLPLGGLVTQANATMVANVSGGTASPTPVNIPTSARGIHTDANGTPGAATGHDSAAVLVCATTSSSGSAEVCNTSPTYTPVAGDSVVFQSDIANTGAFTLNVNSLGAKSVITNFGAALAANDILASPFQVILTYDGTSWRMQGERGNTTGTGAMVLATSPTLVTPALGTPTALVLTNATGLPLTGLNSQANATFVANVSGGSAAPTAAAIPTSAHGLSTGANGGLSAATGHDTAAILTCATSSASGTAETCSTSPTFTPVAGDSIIFQADIANTGAFTLNVNSQGAKGVKKFGSTALVANDILASPFQAVMTYDGTNWEMQGQIGNPPSGSGTVTSFSAGALSPLFTTSVATASSTPALSFTLSNAGAGTVFGNNTSSSAAPAYTAAPVLGVDNTTAGTLQTANGAAAAHTIWSSGATTSNTIAGFTVVPTTGDLVSCTSSGTTCTLTDASVVAANVVTAASNATATKQIPVSAGSNKALSFIDFPDSKSIPFAICVNGAPATGVTTTTTVGGTCRAGTNNKDAYIGAFTSSDSVTFKLHLPKDWDTATAPSLSVDWATTDTTNTHTVILQAQTGCAKLDGTTTDDVALNSAQALGTITINSTANQAWTSTLSSLTTTGCSAPGIMWIKITRSGDTATGLELYDANVTIPRLLTVQAN